MSFFGKRDGFSVVFMVYFTEKGYFRKERVNGSRERSEAQRPDSSGKIFHPGSFSPSVLNAGRMLLFGKNPAFYRIPPAFRTPG